MENLPKKTSRARVSDQLRFWKVGTGQRLPIIELLEETALRGGGIGLFQGCAASCMPTDSRRNMENTKAI